MHDRRRHGTEADCGEDKGQREPPPRITEDEEPDVQPELGIGFAEGRPVLPREVLERVAARGASGEKLDDAQSYDHPDELGFEHLPVTLEQGAARSAGRTRGRIR